MRTDTFQSSCMPPRNWDDSERAALVALLDVRPDGMKVPELVEWVSNAGSALDVWNRVVPATLFGEDPNAEALREAMIKVAGWRRAEFEFHTFMDRTYPERLRAVRQMPPVVFTWGRTSPGEIGVSVVGSRNASRRGLRFAEQVAEELVARDVTVIAGLAAGIDTAAHTAALSCGGRTVAVLGNGLNYQYPNENSRLQQQISEHGMLLSQFWPDARPAKWTFPARNATMSAYGYATVVVEAGEHSGTRIQAREAVAHGRPVILATEVAASTSWGRSLVGQPGVSVASTPTEAVEQVVTVVGREQRIADLLGAL